MEGIFKDILPFLIFIIIIFSRVRKKIIPQNGKRNTSYPTFHIPIIEHYTKEEAVVSERSTEKEASNKGYLTTYEDAKQHDNEYLIEEYINQERETFEQITNTQGIAIREHSNEPISKNEIGKQRVEFNKTYIINGIIMSEVLGKPKALKK